jgi:DNA-binding NarL/FixJ family response regulator
VANRRTTPKKESAERGHSLALGSPLDSRRHSLRPQILLVEDDLPLARGVARSLRPYADVTAAATAAGGSALLRDHQWDGIIVDLVLPDGNGFDIVKGVMGTPVVVFTGHHDAASINRAFGMKARIVAKPDVGGCLVQWAREIEQQFEAALDAWRARYGLTPVELLNLELSAKGFTQQEIAERRGVSLETVRREVKNCLAKMEDETLLAATARFLRSAHSSR